MATLKLQHDDEDTCHHITRDHDTGDDHSMLLYCFGKNCGRFIQIDDDPDLPEEYTQRWITSVAEHCGYEADEVNNLWLLFGLGASTDEIEQVMREIEAERCHHGPECP